MHEATYPCLPTRSPVLSRSDAVLTRSAAAWQLTPPPPVGRQGGGGSRRGPPTLSLYKINQVEKNET